MPSASASNAIGNDLQTSRLPSFCADWRSNRRQLHVRKQFSLTIAPGRSSPSGRRDHAFFRRAGKERLAEVLGTSFLAMDEATRRDGFTDAEFAGPGAPASG